MKDKNGIECEDLDYKWLDELEEHSKELAEKDAVINFLKKELIKKTYCRQVMKRRYRELKQKYESLKNRTKYDPKIRLAICLDKGILPKDIYEKVLEEFEK